MTGDSLHPNVRISALAQGFPCLARAHGVLVWDAAALDRWAAEVPASHGELVTARFLLAVWDPAAAWRCGRFDLMEALRVWDERHREAFLTWASDPWWP